MTVDPTGASLTLPTVELSTQVVFRRLSLFGGVLVGEDGTSAESWTRATRRAHRRSIRPLFLLLEEADWGVADVTYRGVEFAGEFSPPQPLWRGLGGRGWHERRELDKGYAPGTLAVDLTIIFITRGGRLGRR